MAISQYAGIEKLILDTHVLVWYVEGINLTQSQVDVIEKFREKGCLYISAISIWEIALLANKSRIVFSISLEGWIKELLLIPGLHVIELSIPILVQSCGLINYPHKDPADRLIISASRSTNSLLMTFDQKIIDYAKDGYVKVWE